MNFSKKLLAWYKKNRRDLPWRHTKNPYFIWLSEIILQQTRVDQGLPYYLKFAERFPNISDLASAEEDEVLKLWQGLGYYTRARNLHQAAKDICRNSGGVFPSSYNEILKLRGVGKYTAAAISSFAFNLPYPVVDGNVKRVLARIFGISGPVNSSATEKEFYALANELIDKKDPAAFNQAIMEFGAIHCTPSGPKCPNCAPFRSCCVAYNSNRVDMLPAVAAKTKVKTRYFNYLHIKEGDFVYINKRSKNDIWKNLYEFPLIETDRKYSLNEMTGLSSWKEIFGKTKFRIAPERKEYTHVLSHQRIFARFWNIALQGKGLRGAESKKFLKIKKTEINHYPVPRLIEKYFDEKGKGAFF